MKGVVGPAIFFKTCGGCVWSWRAGGGLGKAGGSVRQRTKLEAQVDTAEYAGLEGWRARPRAPGAGTGWAAPIS